MGFKLTDPKQLGFKKMASSSEIFERRGDPWFDRETPVAYSRFVRKDRPPLPPGKSVITEARAALRKADAPYVAETREAARRPEDPEIDRYTLATVANKVGPPVIRKRLSLSTSSCRTLSSLSGVRLMDKIRRIEKARRLATEIAEREAKRGGG